MLRVSFLDSLDAPELMDIGALAPGDVFFLYGDSNPRRSTHIVQRAGDPIPSIITSSAEGNALSPQEATAPALSVHPPTETEQEMLHASETTKEGDDLSAQDVSGSSLDPSSIPLRVIYSPSVSRSGSVSQADQPSILLTQPESGDDSQLIPTESSPSGSRIRSNSFEVRPQQDGAVHRRNLSRNNSTESTTNEVALPTESATQARQAVVLGSSNRRRRLTIEEVAEESDEIANDVVVFKAFADRKWWNSLVAAKIALAIVTAAVMVNLVYSWV